MNLACHPKYFLLLDDKDVELESLSDIKEKLMTALNSKSGKISLSADDGLRPWWQRFIFGSNRYVRMYLAIEWSNGIAGLIFHDENASEYRALSEPTNVKVDEKIRKEISFEEHEPLSQKYCLAKDLAEKAIIEFFEKGEKPQWITYEFVQ
jgi:hypothetical protein